MCRELWLKPDANKYYDKVNIAGSLNEEFDDVIKSSKQDCKQGFQLTYIQLWIREIGLWTNVNKLSIL